ncbi:hypothetical protein OCH239_09360 [Roseivivax halodurans JCM 10272]|uniref:Uncharacterized protein n=2 Tax=Roseivivax halodurans TaxID=93683 RepID=X7ECP1_9RHOB|nr:hypothetical protein OCH239_09360 [Roseivivax halodurans JCM 10272]
MMHQTQLRPNAAQSSLAALDELAAELGARFEDAYRALQGDNPAKFAFSARHVLSRENDVRGELRSAIGDLSALLSRYERIIAELGALSAPAGSAGRDTHTME